MNPYKGSERGKKNNRNFSSAVIETLLIEVSFRKNILFSSERSGVTGPEKGKAWQEITNAINAVCAEERTVSEINKKRFDLKMDAKKRLCAAKRTITATGGGQETVKKTDMDEIIGAIIGEASLSGVQSDIPLDCDLPHPVSTAPTPEIAIYKVILNHWYINK